MKVRFTQDGTSKVNGEVEVFFKKGATPELSDASGAHWVSRGMAVDMAVEEAEKAAAKQAKKDAEQAAQDAVAEQLASDKAEEDRLAELIAKRKKAAKG